jgi:hypothetical protein
MRGTVVFNCAQAVPPDGHTVEGMFKYLLGLALILSAAPLHSQDRPQYRDFVLGSRLSAVTTQVKASASEATVVHERPALIQQLQWRQPYFIAGSNETQTDPVEQIAFSFYNDQLYRLVIDYDRQRTKGMTDADMVRALSEAYGPAAKPTSRATQAAATGIGFAAGVPISRWGTDDYSVVLLRASFGEGFQVVVTSSALDALARTADAQAQRQDQREAPERAIAQQKKAAEEARLSLEATRTTNNAAFRP